MDRMIRHTPEIDHQIGLMRKVAAGIPIKHVWCFDPTQRVDDTPFPNQPLIATNYGTYYLAPFVDGRLVYWDEREARLHAAARDVHLLFDSNMFSVLIAVLLNGSRDQRYLGVLLNLLQHRAVWRADGQAIPYLREIALRTRIISKERNAVQAIEAILRFQGIDVMASLASESIIADDGCPARMGAQFGPDDFAQAAQTIFVEMAAKEDKFPGDMVASYVLFLQMIDTSIRQRNAALEYKLAEADDFICNVLINAQPRLHVLARYFYSRRFDGFLKAQPGNPDFSRPGLRGSIYDLSLAVLHEQLLGSSVPPRADLCVLCTRDAALADYAARFLLRTLAVVGNSYRMLVPWDDEWLRHNLGEDLWSSACQAAENRDVSRMHGPDNPDRMIRIMPELEDGLNIAPQDRLVPAGRENDVAWIVTLED